MSNFTAVINQVATGGPYAYVLFKDGVGLKDSNGIGTIASALDGVKTDIAANLGGQTITRATINVQSS